MRRSRARKGALLLLLPFFLAGCEKEGEPIIEFRIHTEAQQTYLDSPLLDNTQMGIDGSKERSKPLIIPIAIPDSDDYVKKEGATYTLRLSETKEFSSFEEYSHGEDIFELKNLKVHSTYHYTYSVDVDGKRYDSGIKSFRIKDDAPRNLDIDGVTNARDVGGYKTIDGGEIRQGLIYRTGAWHEEDFEYISEEGKEEIHRLGIKTEVDLRKHDENEVLYSMVSGVDYQSFPMNADLNLFETPMNVESTKEVFRLFARKEAYPIAFHCYIGTDRTGFIAFLLGALLGMSEDDLIRDYVFSNFGEIGGSRSGGTIRGRIKTLNTTYGGGGELSVGAENYLKNNVGVSEEEIQAIKDIMLIDSSAI